MIKPRKSKRALTQGIIAFVIAAIIGVVAIAVVFFTIQGVVAYQEGEAQKIQAQVKQRESEIERLKRQNKQLLKQETLQEVKALVEIKPNCVITRSMIDLVEVEHKTPGALTDLRLVIGKRALETIAPLETITLPVLAAVDGVPRIQEGMRAITLKIDPVGGLTGKILPGSMVDVLSTLEVNGQTITKILLQKVSVIGVQGSGAAPAATPASGGKGSTPPPPQAGTTGIWAITLAITPQQAEKLVLANEKGKFHLTLRNVDDPQTITAKGVDVKSVISDGVAKSAVDEIGKPFDGDMKVLSDYMGQTPDPAALGTPKYPVFDSNTVSGGPKQVEIYKGSSAQVKTFDEGSF